MLKESQLIGRWSLASHTFYHQDGNITPTSPWIAGQLIYAEDKSMAVVISKNPEPTSLSELIVYSGRYSLEDKEIIHHIEFSPDSRRIGNKERRFFNLEGDRLVLRTPPSETGHYEIVWHRK